MQTQQQVEPSSVCTAMLEDLSHRSSTTEGGTCKVLPPEGCRVEAERLSLLWQQACCLLTVPLPRTPQTPSPPLHWLLLWLIDCSSRVICSLLSRSAGVGLPL